MLGRAGRAAKTLQKALAVILYPKHGSTHFLLARCGIPWQRAGLAQDRGALAVQEHSFRGTAPFDPSDPDGMLLKSRRGEAAGHDTRA